MACQGNPNMVQELLLREQQEDEQTEQEVEPVRSGCCAASEIADLRDR